MHLGSIEQLEDGFQLPTYKKMPLAIARGSGCWVWTSDGRKFLDLYGGHAVCATGHCHPMVVDALRRQAEQIIFYSNLVYSEVRGRAAERLVGIAPPPLSKAFFCNSGTEANENAMRLARLATGRDKIVSFNGGFHGRTADSISATFLGRYREIGRPNVPLHVAAEFGDIESIRAVADSETAAILIEPIQSMAGVREASPHFFHEIRAVCDERGILLIFDEVQTGIGRTGRWFFAGGEHAGGIVPDIVTIAKSLGSGVPVGACLVSEGLAAAVKENDLGTTFGGGMLAMAAVLATLDAIDSEGMIENARRVEAQIRQALDGRVRSVRGKGCLLGIELDEKASAMHSRLLERGIITGTSSDPNVLRLLPPLCVTSDQIDLFIEAFNE